MLKIVNVKEVFGKALVELSTQKPLEKITVKEIVEQAQAGRQTFYNHFTDKYDLINWFYDSRIEDITALFYTESNLYDASRNMYEAFLKNQQFFTQVAKESNFVEKYAEKSKHIIRKSIADRYGEDIISEELSYAIDYNCYGKAYICYKWIKNGMKETPETLARLNVSTLPDILKPYLCSEEEC